MGDDKPKTAMGYPSSVDRYNEPPQYPFHAPPPPPYPIPCGPQGYAPHPYAPTASYPFPHGYQVDSQQQHQPYPQQQYQPYNNDYYYYQHQQQQMPLVLEPNKTRASFARAMLVLMVFLVSSMCMMTLIMWFLFGAYTPEFEVTSLTVTNFTVTDTSLTGQWHADVAVANRNKQLAMGFDRVMSSIFYKESLLGVEAVEPFHVPPTQRTLLNFTVPTEQLPAERKLQSWVLPMLAEEHGGGRVVYFSLRMAMKANFTTPDMAAFRQENVRVFCENLQVVFSDTTGEGTLSHASPNRCLLRINDDSFKDY